MARLLVLAFISVSFFVACSNEKTSVALTPEQKSQLAQTMVRVNEVDRSLDAATSGGAGEDPDKDLSDFLELLAPCEVVSDSHIGETAGWMSTVLKGEMCPVAFVSKFEYAGQAGEDTIVIEGLKDTRNYHTTSEQVLGVLDVSRFSSEFRLGNAKTLGSAEIEISTGRFSIESLSLGQVSGEERMAVRPMGPKDVSMNWIRNVIFSDFRVEARMEMVLTDWDKEEPTLKSANFWINGQKVSAEEFAEYFPFDMEQTMESVKSALQ